MGPRLLQIEGRRCVVFDGGERVVRGGEDARGLVEAALSERASVVVVPVDALDAAFFELRSGVLGEVAQKLVNYRLTLAVVGDVSGYAAASTAFRDFVVECERGRDVLFVEDMTALERRLSALDAPG